MKGNSYFTEKDIQMLMFVHLKAGDNHRFKVKSNSSGSAEVICEEKVLVKIVK